MLSDEELLAAFDYGYPDQSINGLRAVARAVAEDCARKADAVAKERRLHSLDGDAANDAATVIRKAYGIEP